MKLMVKLQIFCRRLRFEGWCRIRSLGCLTRVPRAQPPGDFFPGTGFGVVGPAGLAGSGSARTAAKDFS